MSERQLTIHRAGVEIPATLTSPVENGRRDGCAAALLLHGTASHRNEVGEMFTRLAAALADIGVASLRIDFAGCGDSAQPQTNFTVENELADATAAYQWLSTLEGIDPQNVFLVGFSQGGMIATLLAADTGAAHPPAGLVSWSSGDIPVTEREALFASHFADGGPSALVDMGFARFRFSREWWEQFRAADVATAAAGYHGPLLAISGAEDNVVGPDASLRLLHAAAGADLTLMQLPGGDHIFNVLAHDGTDCSERVIALTAQWISERADDDRADRTPAETVQ